MNHEDSVIALQNKLTQHGIRTIRIKHRIPDLIAITEGKVIAIEVVRTHVTLQTQDDIQYSMVIHTRNVASLEIETKEDIMFVNYENLDGEPITRAISILKQ